jgi:hypothetical protein
MLNFNPNYRTSDKVWIYTSPAPFSEDQQLLLKKLSETFLNQWESHGAAVRGGVEVLYNHFIIVIADNCDGHLCGRAQDAQVRLMKEMEEAAQCSLLNRMLIGYKLSNSAVKVNTLQDFGTYLQTIENPDKLIVFDTTVTNYGDFVTRFEAPLSTTWMNRFLSVLS